ncbi:amidophosphoribosyltransferase [Corynebacterium sp. ES2794-CONJ1]|uniref:amidophosphoribosyltransferase n=1 Tax=unclassified Corynebacterium TaxID=2624378 RepID=UPI002166C750|nr:MULTISPECIES: amidophosphoribosyltransferase [unclassified Corynebacterium]MCS4490299.1 amidophosphoribosyltransferase [Corynebacterium sp. ES2775-CONJ]MCS4491890.1 amidophosphoribosyltransferase [Corynebacterium sp. ES2715-CONJ3]MCS4531995.1 amidophosphoribosyltransferase [Corynebacterium sp. ES2730-CONJ]MCU9519396.1 amidophosphoribosyltransferase [Corynebacterium sp. ES2794-CONJ1]
MSAYDDLSESAPREECGVFGVWAPGEEVSKLTYFGLFALQHRGQEAAGIAVGDGQQVVVFKDLGLVSQIFDEQTLESLHGDVAIGHTRYSTAGGVTWANSQPMFRVAPDGTDIALAHNGNIVNYLDLLDQAHAMRLVDKATQPSDSDVITGLLAHSISQRTSLLESARTLLPRLKGAFCLTFTDGTTLYAARDPQGVRPLCLGRLDAGWVVASETCALDIVGASFVRDIEPGELLAIDASGIHSERFAQGERKSCVFEYVYLARPDSVINGRSVNAARLEIGRRLAKEWPADGDLVIPVPESGVPAAVGYAQASGIPFGQGLVKNAYVGRTFIQPSQTLRQLGIRLKLNPLREVLEGKRLIVVDDSIVRGNTQRALIRMLREAGASEVHVRIASPPVKWPCFYGIDFASPGELIANVVSGVDEMVTSVCQAIGADSLGFVSQEGMVAATHQPSQDLCIACFDGNYSLGLPKGNINAELVSAIKRGSCGGTEDRGE